MSTVNAALVLGVAHRASPMVKADSACNVYDTGGRLRMWRSEP
jgi:hypothetical protein